MSTMGEPIVKIPGVKPPLGLETRPANPDPSLSPLHRTVLNELRSRSEPAECEEITRALRDDVPGAVFEDVAEALGDLFDLGLAVRPVRGRWEAKRVGEYEPPRETPRPLGGTTAAPIETAAPIPETKAPARETTKPKPETMGVMEYRRQRLGDAIPGPGDEIDLHNVFPDPYERIKVRDALKYWPEFETCVRRVPGVQGKGHLFAKRVAGVPVGLPVEVPRPMRSVCCVPQSATPPTLPVAAEVERLKQRAAQERDEAVRAAHERYAARVDAINWLGAAIGGTS